MTTGPLVPGATVWPVDDNDREYPATVLGRSAASLPPDEGMVEVRYARTGHRRWEYVEDLTS